MKNVVRKLRIYSCMRCKEQGIEGEIYKILVKNIYREKLTTNECYYCIKSDEERS